MKAARHQAWPFLWVGTFMVLVVLWGYANVNAGEKVAIGGLEVVHLLPWGIRLPARVDTGASTSSLDAKDIRIHGKEVEFRLADKYGGTKLRLPIVAWRNYRTTTGRDRRPVVLMEICIGSRRILAEVNITDRSRMELPFLAGRSLLRNRFIVDVDRSFSREPTCTEEISP